MKEFDTIESFLNGNMSASEASDFQRKIDGDPNLKAEVDLQRNTIESIKEMRKAELKARLSSIEIPKGLALSTKLWLTGAAATLLLLSWPTYHALQNEDALEKKPTVKLTKTFVKEETPTVQDLTTINTTSHDVIKSTNSIEKETSSLIETTKKLEKETSEKVITEDINDDIIINQPAFVHDDFFNLEDEDGFATRKSEENPTNNLEGNNTVEKIKTISPEFKEKDKSVLSYQWTKSEDKLTLYGNFDKATPYLLIDLTGKDQLYLKYKNQYYLLIDSQDQQIELSDSKVTDKRLINSLDKKSK